MRPALVRELSIVLALKFAALLVLFLAFFGPGDRVAVTPDGVAASFLAGDATTGARR